jgi:hypothetical protein
MDRKNRESSTHPPEVLERPTRRHFEAEYKLRILEEAERVAQRAAQAGRRWYRGCEPLRGRLRLILPRQVGHDRAKPAVPPAERPANVVRSAGDTVPALRLCCFAPASSTSARGLSAGSPGHWQPPAGQVARHAPLPLRNAT